MFDWKVDAVLQPIRSLKVYVVPYVALARIAEPHISNMDDAIRRVHHSLPASVIMVSTGRCGLETGMS